VLAASPARPHGVDTDILGAYFDIDILGFGQDRNRRC
jgi:hypothetical protein